MLDKGIKYISSLSGKELLVLLIIIAVAILLIRSIVRNTTLISKIKYNVFGARSKDGSDLKELTEARKLDLQNLAEKLHTDIYAILGTAENTLRTINDVNDAEFIYLYKYYISEFSENPYCAVDWEFMPETTEDEKFMSRAKKLNLPIKDAGFFESC